MRDLNEQIRTYYEATTSPVNIDAVTVEEGTVVVGPFPDAVQRRSAMKTITPTPGPVEGATHRADSVCSYRSRRGGRCGLQPDQCRWKRR